MIKIFFWLSYWIGSIFFCTATGVMFLKKFSVKKSLAVSILKFFAAVFLGVCFFIEFFFPDATPLKSSLFVFLVVVSLCFSVFWFCTFIVSKVKSKKNEKKEKK